MKIGILAFLFSLLLVPLNASANPYLAKPAVLMARRRRRGLGPQFF
jgi:hypothetical protein